MSRQKPAWPSDGAASRRTITQSAVLLSESNEMAATPTSHFVRTNPILLRGDRAAGRCEALSPSLVPENFPESLMFMLKEDAYNWRVV